MANVLARLGTRRSWGVHGEDGLDEITLSGRTLVFEICCEHIREFEISPLDFGTAVVYAVSLPRASTPSESESIIRNVFENERGRNIAESLVAINAAAGIYLPGATDSLQDAYAEEVESIRSGKASEKLHALARATSQ